MTESQCPDQAARPDLEEEAREDKETDMQKADTMEKPRDTTGDKPSRGISDTNAGVGRPMELDETSDTATSMKACQGSEVESLRSSSVIEQQLGPKEADGKCLRGMEQEGEYEIPSSSQDHEVRKDRPSPETLEDERDGTPARMTECGSPNPYEWAYCDLELDSGEWQSDAPLVTIPTTPTPKHTAVVALAGEREREKQGANTTFHLSLLGEPPKKRRRKPNVLDDSEDGASDGDNALGTQFRKPITRFRYALLESLGTSDEVSSCTSKQ